MTKFVMTMVIKIFLWLSIYIGKFLITHHKIIAVPWVVPGRGHNQGEAYER